MKKDKGELQIFIVEDDRMFLEVVTDHILEANPSAEVIQFTTGEDCLAELGLEPDVVVLDFFLNKKKPDAKDGLHVLREIKAANAAIQVVVLSAQDELEVAVETMRVGAFDYIVKNDAAFVRLNNVLQQIAEMKQIQAELMNYRQTVGHLWLPVDI